MSAGPKRWSALPQTRGILLEMRRPRRVLRPAAAGAPRLQLAGQRVGGNAFHLLSRS